MNRLIPKLALLLVFLTSTFGMNANPVDINTAREVAVKFMNANAKAPVRGIVDLHLVTTYNINRGDAAFYIFNTSNGFVIVSADDCATPILGYSNEGQFDTENIPIQLQDYLQGFVEQIQYGIENHIEADGITAQQWELVRTTGRLTNNRTDEVVEPLIATMWDQDCYYNAMCPEDENGPCGHVYAGSVATAMAQIMHYWGYPEHGTGSHSYTPNGYPEQNVDFEATTYDWENMPNSLNASSSSEQIDAVATLIWHCGVSVDTDYSLDESGDNNTGVNRALTDFFSYSDESDYDFPFDSDATWKARLKDCLNLGRPLLYEAHGFQPGVFHAFVCDGYDNYDLFHFNFCWSGSNNGYYAINAIFVNLSFSSDYYEYNYNAFSGAVFNIHPQGETTNYVINVSANNDLGGIVSGGGTFDHGRRVILAATANNGYKFCYWEENGGIASTDPLYIFNANFNRNLTAVFIRNENIVFADDNVKAICVANWDTNGDGELSFAEAAMVTELGSVFTNNTEITSFEELQYFIGLTSINNEAFNNCSGLTGSLFIPNSVTWIGRYAFCNCSGLTGSLYIPNRVTSIGNYAFYNCCGFTGSLTIPDAVTYIGDNAFMDCTGFTGSLTLSNSVAWISNQAFMDCTGFTGSLTLPNSLVHIGAYAFNNCSGLNGFLTISNSLTVIDDSVFSGCSGLIGLLTIPNSVTSIGSYAFYGCSGFTGQLIIPNSVTSIEFSAFNGCCGLRGSLTIPDSVTSISSYAFYDCSGFTGTLTIPNSITSIGNRAFYGCNNFTSMIVLAETPPTIGSYTFSYFNIPLYVLCESVETYQVADGWRRFTNTINGMCSTGTISVTAAPTEGGVVTGAGIYESGSFCTVIATPNENYTFVYWTENGAVVSTQPEYTFLVPTDRTLVAHFTLPLNITTAAEPAEGGVVSDGGLFDYGSACIVSAIPSENYTFMYWTENGNVVSTRDEYSFIVMDNRNLTAHFALPFNITVAAEPAEGGTVSGGGAFNYGTTCTLTATPNPGYVFNNWTTNGSVVSCLPSSTITVTENAEYVANFQQIDDIIIGDGACENSYLPTYYYYSLTEQIYTANEMGVEATDISSVSFFNTSTLNITRDMSVYMVNTSKNSFGSKTDWIPVTDANLVFDGSVTMAARGWVTIYFNTPFVYDGVSNVALIVDDNSNRYNSNTKFRTFTTDVSQALRIYSSGTNYDPYAPTGYTGTLLSEKNQVVFGIPSYDYTVTVSADPFEGGTVSGGGGACFYGQPITITATPNEGYVFLNWVKDGNVVSYLQSFSFSVTENANYVANFAAVNEGNIVFADLNVKAICVANWDSDGDGELSYVEAAAVKSLGEVFRGNTEITSFEELQFFIGLRSISNHAFNGCSGLTGSLMLPGSITSIGIYAFYGCGGLTGSLTIPDHVTSIGSYAFFNCSELTGPLALGNSVTSIDFGAFYGCSGLTGSLTIPNNVASIGSYAFYNCSGFTGDLTIPNSVTSIGNYAFHSCSNLTSITTRAQTPPTIASNTFYNWPKSIPVYLPCGSLEAYQSAEYWSEFTNIQEDCNILTSHFIAAGDWSDVSNWESGALPDADDVVYIDAPCQLDMGAEVVDLIITANQSLTLQPNKTLTVTGTLTNTSAAGLVIEDGAQLVHDSENVSAMVKKNIAGHGSSNGKYSIISNPLTTVVDPEMSSVYHLITGDNDLYDWLPNASDHLEWRNFKDNLFVMSPDGYGYLYANRNGVELNFPGILKPSHNRYAKSVSHDSNDTEHPGWNLIGNPFVCNAYLVDEEGTPLPYYRMNAAGDGIESVAPGTPIAPMEGVFYNASGNGTVYFTRIAPSEAAAKQVKRTVKQINDNMEYSTLGDLEVLAGLKENLEKQEKARQGE